MKYTATFNELKEAGFSVEFISASASYDMTAVVKLESSDKNILYVRYWIGDGSYRYANSLNGILTGEGQIRFYDCMMMTDNFKEIEDYEIFSYIKDGTSEFLENDNTWNEESRKAASDLGADYMIKMFNKS